MTDKYDQPDPLDKPVAGSGDTITIGNIVDADYVAIGRGATVRVTNITMPTPGAKQRPSEEQILLDKVNAFWIKGILENFLFGSALIELGKEYRPEAVDYPWDMVVQRADAESRPLPKEKTIIDVFDDAGGSLLILGKPGSGKTTMLLDLARRAISRCRQDPNLSVPGIFNLSSWRPDQPLVAWLVDELSEKYMIPRKLGRLWVENDRLTLLLDGLDEVTAASRNACVLAINHFRQEHLASVVVCSRADEYEATGNKLKVESAVFLRPLTPQQVNIALDQAGSKLSSLRFALQEDDTLQEMALSPLMLNIMVLAYQDVPPAAIGGLDDMSARRQHIFAAYVRQMFRRRPATSAYSEQQSVKWLSWLAAKLSKQNETLFLIEDMQPTWLSTNRQVKVYWLIFRLLLGFSSFLLYSKYVLIIFLGALLTGVVNQPGALTLILALSLSGLLLLGLLGALGTGKQFAHEFKIRTFERLSYSWKEGIKAGLVGVPFGAGLGALGVIISWVILIGGNGGITGLRLEPVDLLIGGLIGGLLNGAIFILYYGLTAETIELRSMPNQGIRLSIYNAIFAFLLVGVPAGFLAGLIGVLINGPVFGLAVGLVACLLAGLQAAYWKGARSAMLHYTLRWLLYLDGRTPRHYVHFLDAAAERIFLHKIGGGYLFIHRLFMEHLAETYTNNPPSNS